MIKIQWYENYYISENWVIQNDKWYVFKKVIRHWYEMVLLSKNKIRKNYFVHRLVAINYIWIVEDKPHINHKDWNKRNNHYSNLERCTPNEKYFINIKLYELFRVWLQFDI